MNGILFANSMLLWGLFGAAVPVVVHLFLRARPRRLRFPALALMRDALVVGQRANRVRNLLLLLLRTVLIAVAVLLLAGPTCRQGAATVLGGGPVADVLVLDDSISTQYRPQYDADGSLFARIRSGADAHLNRFDELPAGSRGTVIASGQVSSPERLVAQSDDIRRVFDSTADSDPHAAGLGGAIRSAGVLLRDHAELQPRLTIFTDGTRAAWRDVRPAMLAGVDRIWVDVRCVCPEDWRNMGVIGARPMEAIVAASRSVPLLVSFRSQGVDSACWFEVDVEGTTIARRGPIELKARHEVQAEIALPAGDIGVATGVVRLEPMDLWPYDHAAYFVWQRTKTPDVWLIEQPSAEGRPLTGLILQNLLAPTSLSEDVQRVRLWTLGPDALADRAAADEPSAQRHPALIVVPSGVEIGPAALSAIELAVQGGTALLLVPSTPAASAGWLELWSLMSSVHPMLETGISASIRIGDASRVLPEEVQEALADCLVVRRWRAEANVGETRVMATYQDDVPAVIGRRFGRGTVVAITTSPDPAWSELGIRAAGLLTWLHHLVAIAANEPNGVGRFTVGAATHHRFETLAPDGLVHVTRVAPDATEAGWIRLRGGVPEEPWPTSLPGAYEIRPARAGEPLAAYAVNWPAEEGAFERVAEDEIVASLGYDTVRVSWVNAGDVGGSEAAVGWIRPDWVGVLSLLLVGLFALEPVVAVLRESHRAGKQKAPATPP